MDDDGSAISYKLLERGTPIHASDGTRLGTVDRVLENEREHIFDGIVMRTDKGERFVDAPEVEGLYERAVVLTLSSGQASSLPEHSASPAVLDVSADDVTEDTAGDKARGVAKRAWNRISGNY